MLEQAKVLGACFTKPASILTEFSILFCALFLAPPLQAQSFTTSQSELLMPVLEAMPDATEYTALQFGAYDLRLINPLFIQARQLQEAENHVDASRLYREALHILRINNGLYDASQVPVLDSLIESEIALQDWESVDKYYGYMEHLYRRLYPLEDPRLELGLQKVVSWHVNAINVNIDGKRIEHLQQANKLFKLRLQMAELTLTADDPKLDFLYRNIAICERQLYLSSDLNKEMLRRQEKRHQSPLLADRD